LKFLKTKKEFLRSVSNKPLVFVSAQMVKHY
jgi:hypothetical protein